MNSFLINRRTAWQSKGIASLSSWTFDISQIAPSAKIQSLYNSDTSGTSTTLLSPRTIAILPDSSALIACSTTRIFKYYFDSSAPGEISSIIRRYGASSSTLASTSSSGTIATVLNPSCDAVLSCNGVSYNSSYPLRLKKLDSVGAIVFTITSGGTASDEYGPTSYSVGWTSKLTNEYTSAFAIMALSVNGRHFYSVSGNYIYDYTLSVPFDLSTAQPRVSISLRRFYGASLPNCVSFCFSPDGYRLVWFSASSVLVFDLAVAWSPTSGVVYRGSFSPAISTIVCGCVDWNGRNIYFSTASGIYQFELPESSND